MILTTGLFLELSGHVPKALSVHRNFSADFRFFQLLDFFFKAGLFLKNKKQKKNCILPSSFIGVNFGTVQKLV